MCSRHNWAEESRSPGIMTVRLSHIQDRLVLWAGTCYVSRINIDWEFTGKHIKEVFTTWYPHHGVLFRCRTSLIGSLIAIKWFGTLGLFLRSSRLITPVKHDHKVSRVSLIHPSDVQNGLQGAQEATLVSTTQLGGGGVNVTLKKELQETPEQDWLSFILTVYYGYMFICINRSFFKEILTISV